MLDFLMISARIPKKGIVEIYPKFIICESSDLMIRGGDFYAIWNDDQKLWSTDEQVALKLIDIELSRYAKEHKEDYPDMHTKVLYMWDAESGSIDRWHKFVQKQMRDKYHPLDETLIFSNVETTKKDYASKKLPYPFEEKDIPAYDEMMSKLYSPEERQKIEWAIGAIVSGESKYIQKFIVMYGAPGTGKSTVLNIIQDLFDGYYSIFDSQALGSSSNAFALEAFRSNPLIAIQHDGDLSHLENTPRLNSIVSHEEMTVNEKFKATYTARFNSFIIMGTNKPVKITDAKSGLLRRLIDVSPTGEKIPKQRYEELKHQIKFELGGIAYHCMQVYKSNSNAYDDYIPLSMLGASNDFYNFVMDSYDVFKREDNVTLKSAWEMYKVYCDDAKVAYPYPQRAFKEELKNYFRTFKDRALLEDDQRVRNYYSGFIFEKFETCSEPKNMASISGFSLDYTESIFDKIFENCPAQYATKTENQAPLRKWEDVTTKLKDISTNLVHYVLPQGQASNLVCVDFDLKDEYGKKSYELNAAAASKWPPTYAELSKGGEGIHLYYYYDGDTSKLSRIFDNDIEIKTFFGNSSLRRRVIRCNNLPIATLNSGLPMKEDGKMINFEGLKNERSLRTFIKKNLNKEYHCATKPSVDFIFKGLEDAYASGMEYDVTDLKQDILCFAASSTHQSAYCINLVSKMKFKSENMEENKEDYPEKDIVFYDVEVFSNLFVVVYKAEGKNPVKMINPSPAEIENLLKFKLVGFNCRKYDNHILYARILGYSNEELYILSQKIIGNVQNTMFGEAYNISYTDIYDFASSGNKKSLKKLEIEMGIHHQELGFKWDQPVPEDKFDVVADYCVNDVIATEAAFHYLKADWMARKILAKITNSTVNDTTNTLTTKLIFGNNKHPQNEFVYTDLSTIFPGYTFSFGKSLYRGEDPKEGGYVYSNPGIWGNVALLDIASMHPHSVIALNLFGDRYTAKFQELVNTRIAVKHKDREAIRTAFDGRLAEFADSPDEDLAALADALKTAINSVYGLTSAGFDNPFRDPRNKDNIVAKRGALFMINLRDEVMARGFKVAHIKTDSIKIPDATPEIIQFVTDYGKQYGYTFEHEATYDKMCLVNDAVYIAQYASVEKCINLYGDEYINSSPDICKKNKKKAGKWEATGAQFQQPYVYKKLFSKEPIEFNDKCETKTVTSALYLDMNEGLGEGEHDYHFVGKAGQFCPIKAGRGGGELVREGTDKDGNIKYSSATGAKGYRWLESEMVKTLEKENDIDEKYYISLVDDAVSAIDNYGDFEWFVSNDPYVKEDPHILPF